MDQIDKCKGIFSMRVIDRDGNIVEEYTDHNVIVNGSKKIMAHLIGDSDASQTMRISKLYVGEGASAAAATDTDLTNKSGPFEVTPTYPKDANNLETGSVQFAWSVGYNDANGKSISEFGLYTNGSDTDGSGATLFARKQRGAIAKDNTLKFDGTWTIVF